MVYQSIELLIRSAGSGYVEGEPVAVLRAYIQDSYHSAHSGSELRPAVIVCPGSGYKALCAREAEPVVMRFLASGMQAFLLSYSVAPCKYPCAILELARAVSLVREHAEEWRIDPHRVFVCGFSAGGHVCAMLGTRWSDPIFQEPFHVRPDGMILCYPLISFEKFSHPGSVNMLLGMNPSNEMLKELSAERHVTAKTPPAFLWHTYEDQSVPVENSLMFAEALRKCGIPFELHVYEKGIHGMALCDETTADPKHPPDPDSAGWMDLAIRWIYRFKPTQQ